jgi:hypothetical protein
MDGRTDGRTDRCPFATSCSESAKAPSNEREEGAGVNIKRRFSFTNGIYNSTVLLLVFWDQYYYIDHFSVSGITLGNCPLSLVHVTFFSYSKKKSLFKFTLSFKISGDDWE